MPETMTFPVTRQGVRNLDEIEGAVLPVSWPTRPEPRVNVGQTERWASVLGGALLAAYGLSTRGATGLSMGALGGALIYRGLTGHCQLYGALGVRTTGPVAESRREVIHRPGYASS